MSLDTVLQIGKVLRKAENNLKYFKYIEPCPKDKEGNYPLCITIPVKNDFSFDWEHVKITPENERNNLYYLKFKTSDSDGLVKYIFGDIYYERNFKINKKMEIEKSEGGYYRLENPLHTNAAYRLSSFKRGQADFNEIIENFNAADSLVISKFHNAFNDNIQYIERMLAYIPAIEKILESNNNQSIKEKLKDENLLKSITIMQVFEKNNNNILKKLGIETNFESLSDNQKEKLLDVINSSIFLHFEFENKKHWYMFKKDLSLINEKILSDFVDSTKNGLVLKKTLYKTLCSGDKKNDIQFPAFLIKNKHKSKLFQNEEIQNLFYALDYTNKGRLISGTDIKMIILPIGKGLSANDYENFLIKKDETRILAKNKIKKEEKADEPLFDFFSDDENNAITSFDLIFCKKGGLTSPDSDLIEISGIEKSKLRQTKERIRTIASDIYKERKMEFKTDKELSPISIEFSFRNLLGNPQRDFKTGKIFFKPNPKYQSHLLKVLPLIYTDNYFQDGILISSFIQNAENSIRAGDERYSFLKYDLKFLLKIQNSKNDKFMEITQSESYKIGLMLGDLAKNLSLEINSFEKNYVGTLTRRIGNLSDFIKFKNEIEQKLIMHDKTRFTYQTSYELAQKVKEFKSRYDKEECAFGFMESYFKPIPSKKVEQ